MSRIIAIIMFALAAPAGLALAKAFPHSSGGPDIPLGLAQQLLAASGIGIGTVKRVGDQNYAISDIKIESAGKLIVVRILPRRVTN